MTDDQILYGFGACHIHAIAAHAWHGGSFLVLTDPDPVWASLGKDMPRVIHVLSLHPTRDGHVARDVFGDRRRPDVISEARTRYGIADMREEVVATMSGLSRWIDAGRTNEAPLRAYRADEVHAAMALESVCAKPGSRPVALVGEAA